MDNYKTRRLIIARDGKCCFYCLKELDYFQHIDHKIPIVKGGTNDLSNLVMACRRCNTSKGPKTDTEFLAHGRPLTASHDLWRKELRRAKANAAARLCNKRKREKLQQLKAKPI